MIRFLAVAFLAACLGGCTAIKSFTDASETGKFSLIRNGPNRPSSDEAIKAFKAQQEFIALLKTAYGIPAGTAPTVAQYGEMFDGMTTLIGRNCFDYLRALDRLDVDRSTAVAELGLFGGAASALLAAFEVAAAATAATAAGFALASQSLDTAAKNVLFDLPPYSVLNLVESAEGAYYRAVPRPQIDSDLKLFAALEGYYQICSPVKIRGLVADALAKAKPVASAPGAAAPAAGAGGGFFVPIIGF